jgi:ribosome-binding protein aMBF1 (putative translation factor)
MEEFDHLDPDVRAHRSKREHERDRTGLNTWLAQRIAARRVELDMSVEELARRVGKSAAWVRRLESPSSDPRYNDLQRVMTELRLSLWVENWPE